MFTQRDEEKYILKFFKGKIGRFLDIGSHDGQCFSTTRALALKGWGGVCIEPSPSVLPALHKRYDDSSNIDIIEAAVVSTVSGPVTFFDSNGDMISSTSSQHAEKWKKKAGVIFKQIKVHAFLVKDLFSKIGYDFDFISLDVEGTNIEIFSLFPFKKLEKTKMLCVEFDLRPEKVKEIVKPFNFTLLHQTAENMILVRS